MDEDLPLRGTCETGSGEKTVMASYELRGTQHPRTGEEHLWITRDGQSIGLEEVATDLAWLQSEIERLRDENDWLRRKLAVYEGDLVQAGGDDE